MNRFMIRASENLVAAFMGGGATGGRFFWRADKEYLCDAAAT